MKIDPQLMNNRKEYYFFCEKLFQEHIAKGEPCYKKVWEGELEHPEDLRFQKDVQFELPHPLELAKVENNYFEMIDYEVEGPAMSCAEGDSYEFADGNPYTNDVLDRAVIPQKHRLNDKIKEILKLDYARSMVNTQLTGNIIPPHTDKNSWMMNYLIDQKVVDNYKWTDIKRYFYFYDDQKYGQMMMMGNQMVKWKKGDMIEYPFWMKHTSANAWYQARPILSITGCTKENTWNRLD